MHLVVFDVDETLIDTGTVDMDCFWQAAREIFRLPSDYPTWVEGLKDVTGVAILSLFCEQALARKISASELDRFKGRFVGILEAAVLKNDKNSVPQSHRHRQRPLRRNGFHGMLRLRSG